MAQGEGYWYNPETNVAILVHRHEIDLKNNEIQKKLDLPNSAVDALKTLSLNPKNEDKIKMVGVRVGLVRSRDWQKFTSVQFFGQGNKAKDILFSIAELIEAYKNKNFEGMDKETIGFAKLLSTSWQLKIDNLRTRETDMVSPNEFLKKYAKEGYMEEKKSKKTPERPVKDIPMSESLNKEVEDLLQKHGFFKEDDIASLFEDRVVKREINKCKEILNEEKLSRVWQLAEKEGWVWGIVTSYRGENSETENREIIKKLKDDVRDAGYGFWELDGRWIETSERGEKVDVGERVLFVAAEKGGSGDEMREFIMDMVKKYNQDAGIYKDDPNDSNIMLYQYKTQKDGERVVDEDHFSIGKFHPGKIGEAYSKIDKSGRTFVFESVVEYNAGSFMGAMSIKAYERKFGLL